MSRFFMVHCVVVSELQLEAKWCPPPTSNC